MKLINDAGGVTASGRAVAAQTIAELATIGFSGIQTGDRSAPPELFEARRATDGRQGGSMTPQGPVTWARQCGGRLFAGRVAG